MKKIKSVKRNGVEYIPAYGESRMWQSRKQMGDALLEWVHEDVIRNCPLFEVEYESERWRAKYGGVFYYMSYTRHTNESVDERKSFPTECYNAGNYFKSREQVQRYIDESQKGLEEFHRREGNYE